MTASTNTMRVSLLARSVVVAPVAVVTVDLWDGSSCIHGVLVGRRGAVSAIFTDVVVVRSSGFRWSVAPSV